jgi:hypothetical protein
VAPSQLGVVERACGEYVVKAAGLIVAVAHELGFRQVEKPDIGCNPVVFPEKVEIVEVYFSDNLQFGDVAVFLSHFVVERTPVVDTLIS